MRRIPHDLYLLLLRAERREFRAAGWDHAAAADMARIYMTQEFGA